VNTVGGWLDAIAHLIVLGWIYWLTARVQRAITNTENATASANEATATAVAVLEAVTAPVDELADELTDETDEPDTDEYPAYVLVDNRAADVHPTAPVEPVAPDWVEEQLASFSFMEGHQR
jgi:hypothetical protein